MDLLFELSKEHKTIPFSEIISVLSGEEIDYKIIKRDIDSVIINIKDNINIKILKNRISMAFFIGKLLFSCDSNLDSLEKKLKKFNFDEKGSIAIRYNNRSKKHNSKDIVKILAKYFTKNRIVDLENPDIEIRALITDSKFYITIKLYKIIRSEFEKRKVQYRPFFQPISLHPKIARALVNLACIRRNQLLLDPFCGTGGILLEAGLIDIKIIGSDIEEKMISGCKKTLEYYNLKNFKLYTYDIGEISNNIDKVDAVVTDLPYGKSTTTKGEDIKLLYDRAFFNISKVLKEKSRAVIGLSDKEGIKIGEKYLKLVEIHEFRAHKSLTRYFVVFKK